MAEHSTENNADSESHRQTRFSAGAKKSKWHINRKMLPIKALYFFFHSTQACVVPYLAVYMKLLGLTSSESGVIIGIMPFVAFLAQPFIGMIADHWALHKTVMVVALIFTGTFHVLLSVVPTRPHLHSDVIVGDVIVTCHPREPLALSFTHCFDPSQPPLSSNTTEITSTFLQDAVLCQEKYPHANLTSQSTSRLCDDTEAENAPTIVCPRNIHDVLNLLYKHSHKRDGVPRDGLEHGDTDSERINSEVHSDIACSLLCPAGELPDDDNNNNNKICLLNEGATLNTNPSSLFSECNGTANTFPVKFLIKSLHKHNASLSRTFVGNEDDGLLDPTTPTRTCVEEKFQIISITESGHTYDNVLCYPRLKLRCVIQCTLTDEFRDACLDAEKRSTFTSSSSSSSSQRTSTSSFFDSDSISVATASTNPTINNNNNNDNNNNNNNNSYSTTTTADTTTSSVSDTFWLFFVFYLLGYLGFAPVYPMIDAACYTLLKDDWRKFGQNRVWGTIAWVVVAGVMAAAVYLEGGELRYEYLFYSYGVASALSTILTCLIPLPSDLRCGNVLSNLRQVLALPKVLALLGIAMVAGMQFGACSFVLWFLEEEFQAPPTIFGPVVVMSVVPEVIGFFFTGRVIRRFGPNPCICFAVLTSSLRLIGYCLLEKPWLVLLVEPLHGIAISALIAATSVYMTWITPPELSATSQSLLCGVQWSLGRGTGVILTGWLFGVMDARMTFLVYAVLGVVTSVVYAMLYRCVFGHVSPSAINIDVIVTDIGQENGTQPTGSLTVEPVRDDPSTEVTEKTTMLSSQLYANGSLPKEETL